MDLKIKPLNDSSLGRLSIEELENRLHMEELDMRNEMWTGCGCAEYCGPEAGPCRDFGAGGPCDMKDCVPFVCWRGTF